MIGTTAIWPDRSLPLPRFAGFEGKLDGSREVLVPTVERSRKIRHFGAEGERTHAWYADTKRDLLRPSGETYLRLAELDLDDPDAILAFAREYGLLGGALAARAVGGLVGVARLDLEAERAKKHRALIVELARHEPEIDTAGVDAAHSVAPTLDEFPPLVETVEEFRFAARCLRDLYWAWRAYREGLDVAEIKWVSFSDPDAEGTIFRVNELLQWVLREFLSGFQPALVPMTWFTPESIREGTKPQDFANTVVCDVMIEPMQSPEGAPLYAICALELFNHILEKAEYRRCANERCQRTFVHHQGRRSENGWHRSRGVLYCDVLCARATAQREYRRRRASRERTNGREHE